jgi:hypothetical protein
MRPVTVIFKSFSLVSGVRTPACAPPPRRCRVAVLPPTHARPPTYGCRASRVRLRTMPPHTPLPPARTAHRGSDPGEPGIMRTAGLMSNNKPLGLGRATRILLSIGSALQRSDRPRCRRRRTCPIPPRRPARSHTTRRWSRAGCRRRGICKAKFSVADCGTAAAHATIRTHKGHPRLPCLGGPCWYSHCAMRPDCTTPATAWQAAAHQGFA